MEAFETVNGYIQAKLDDDDYDDDDDDDYDDDDDTGLLDEFTHKVETPEPYVDDESQIKHDQNRYGNVIPSSDTRVALMDENGLPMYVNANRIYDTIVTQAPLPASMVAFWKMIHDFDVHVIVALVNSNEFNQRAKATPYWEYDGYTCVFDTNVKKDNKTEKINVRVKFEHDRTQTDTFVDVRMFSLISRVNNQDVVIRTVTQYHYKVWPDQLVPETGRPFEALAALIIMVCKDARKTKHIPLVHCSAGIGRSGVFVAALTTIELYYAGLLHATAPGTGTPLNTTRNFWREYIPDVVSVMRQSRENMVQTFPQYRLVYQLVSRCMTILREEMFNEEPVSRPVASSGRRWL